MKQLKFRERFKVALSENLYQELLDLHPQTCDRDMPFQDFVIVMLWGGVQAEQQRVGWKPPVVGHEAGRPSSPAACRIMNLAGWKRGHGGE